jgi:type II secretory pathway pseudopilin PulG
VTTGRWSNWVRRRSAAATNGPTRAEGFSLIELLVAFTIGVVVLTLVATSIATGLFSQTNGIAFGKATDEASLAITQLQRATVNASEIFNPATQGANAGIDVPAGYSLRILTTHQTTHTCEQWAVVTHNLEYRSWSASKPVPGSWNTLVTGVTNEASTPGTTPPFALATTPDYGKRLINVHLKLKAGSGSSTAATSLNVSFTAVDAAYGTATPTVTCGVTRT